MATISSLLDIGLMVWLQYPPLLDIGLFEGRAKIYTLLDIGLMVWLQYPFC